MEKRSHSSLRPKRSKPSPDLRNNAAMTPDPPKYRRSPNVAIEQREEHPYRT